MAKNFEPIAMQTKLKYIIKRKISGKQKKIHIIMIIFLREISVKLNFFYRFYKK